MKIFRQTLLLILFLIPTFGAEIVHRFPSDMTLPTDVAVLEDGRICVADGVNQRILVFGSSGQSTILTFPELKRPLGLAADHGGGLLVTDTKAKTVFILDKYLKLQVAIPLAEEIDPTDILAVEDLLWVVDNEGHRVLVISRTGKIKETLGKKGSAGPTFSYPSTISAGKPGQVFVCDVLNGRIQLFNDDLSYQGQIADWGIINGLLFRPKGVASRPDGKIVVSDSFTGTLQLFLSQSSPGNVLSDTKGNPLRFQNPTGVVWDKSGLLWVVESGSGSLIGVKVP